jgi:MoxR-like ATPase
VDQRGQARAFQLVGRQRKILGDRVRQRGNTATVAAIARVVQLDRRGKRGDGRFEVAAQALVIAAQAAAAIEGRDFATPDDVKSVAPLVLPHRLIVRPESEVEGLDAETILARILAAVDVPKDVARPAVAT